MKLFLLLLFIISLPVHTQEILVLDQTTLQPIPDVSLYLPSRQYSTLTDAKGAARLPDALPGDTVIIQHLAYQPLRLTLARINADGGRIFMVERFLKMDEVVIAASRWEEDRSEIPRQMATISAREISFTNPQTTADMLQNLGEVFVQKSQMGGGSPVLRGFEANRVLLVVDGVRMNNAIYRSGHLQNVILLDAAGLDNAEVLFGPGSVLYGSDALGGVMDFHTKASRYSSDGLTLSGMAFTRFASANTEKTGHLDLNIGLRNIAFLTSLTYSDFDDLRSGNIYNPAYGNWGRRPFYVERIAGKDSVVQNDNPNVQRRTGYSQINALQKVSYRSGANVEAQYSLHYSTSSDVPRYDRLTEMTGGNPSFADWYYGPQKWVMNALRLNITSPLSFSDRIRFTVAHQRIDEDRISRRFNNPNKRRQEEDVTVLSFNLDVEKQFDDPGHQLFYGAEVVLNDVESSAHTENIVTGTQGRAATRYPGGGSILNTLAGYASYKWFISERSILSAGTRFSHTRLRSTFGDTTFYKFPVDRIELDNSSVTGSLGLVLTPIEEWRFSMNLSSGFRSPNVDDVGKVFDSSPGKVIIPNAELKPENAYSVEAFIEKEFGDGVRCGLRGYYTLLQDAIVVRNATFNGLDSIVYDGRLSRVQSAQNAAEAIVSGASADILADVTPALSIAGTVTYTYGRDRTSDVPLDHIPPVFGQTRFIFRRERFKGEFFIRFNGWKKVGDYSPSGEDNLSQATPFGMPSWLTLNLRGSYQLSINVQITAALENILDDHYRVFASGVSAPGRNAVLALHATW